MGDSYFDHMKTQAMRIYENEFKIYVQNMIANMQKQHLFIQQERKMNHDKRKTIDFSELFKYKISNSDDGNLHAQIVLSDQIYDNFSNQEIKQITNNAKQRLNYSK